MFHWKIVYFFRELYSFYQFIICRVGLDHAVHRIRYRVRPHCQGGGQVESDHGGASRQRTARADPDRRRVPSMWPAWVNMTSAYGMPSARWATGRSRRGSRPLLHGRGPTAPNCQASADRRSRLAPVSSVASAHFDAVLRWRQIVSLQYRCDLRARLPQPVRVLPLAAGDAPPALPTAQPGQCHR